MSDCGDIAQSFVPGGSDVTGAGAARTNSLTNVLVTYVNPVNPTSGLRNALLTFGQPNFFTAANLPAGDGVPISPGIDLNISNFWVSSSQARALGFTLRNPTMPDGF